MNRKKQKEENWIIKEKYGGRKTEELASDLRRLKAGEPVAYIIGYVDFLGCKIDLDEKPLIPRPETEYWTELVIAKIRKNGKKNIYCLDIFSGSGCIGIAILKNIPDSKVVFAERSAKFCRQIRKNLDLNGISSERYQIIRANIFRPLEAENFPEGFDYILANPPYIPEERETELDKSVTAWEPPEALFAKEEGLLIIKRFLGEVKKYLNSSGEVWLEFDISQNLKIKKMLEEGGFKEISFHKDQYSRWRFVHFAS